MMTTTVLSILCLGVLCACWVVVQRWIALHDPGQPGVNGKCHSCGPKDAGGGVGTRSRVGANGPVDTAVSSEGERFSV